MKKFSIRVRMYLIGCLIGVSLLILGLVCFWLSSRPLPSGIEDPVFSLNSIIKGS